MWSHFFLFGYLYTIYSKIEGFWRMLFLNLLAVDQKLQTKIGSKRFVRSWGFVWWDKIENWSVSTPISGPKRENPEKNPEKIREIFRKFFGPDSENSGQGTSYKCFLVVVGPSVPEIQASKVEKKIWSRKAILGSGFCFGPPGSPRTDFNTPNRQNILVRASSLSFSQKNFLPVNESFEGICQPLLRINLLYSVLKIFGQLHKRCI